jgi:Domain of unknown function (DUF4326)
MTGPKRIQLRRTAGWRKPEGAIVVSRPSKWGNPYRIRFANLVVDQRFGHEYSCAQGEARGVAVRHFREDLVNWRLSFDLDDVERELSGHDLACWCALDQPCHADVLLELANES